jgi:hypothetical protein
MCPPGDTTPSPPTSRPAVSNSEDSRQAAVPRLYTAPVVVHPYGGAAEIAWLDLEVHKRNVWTGRCKACKEPAPCRTRREALAATDGGVA